MEKAIEVRDLCKKYYLYANPQDRFKENFSITKKIYHKEKKALDNINFSVEKGECVGIIGTNGSGKSTLLKIITGVLTPTSGTVFVDGKVSALLELGAGFNPEYTGIENIFLNGRMMGYSRSEMEQKMDDILSFADIGEYIHQPVKTYSSGMFARLAFSVAISVEPEVLIVDEALSVGDIFFQNKCFKKFDELKQNGTTIILVSHDLESVKSMASRVLWIEQGTQMMFGEGKSVCNEYAKSILLKNNIVASNMEKSNVNLYNVKKFEIEKYPALLDNNENLLSEHVKIVSCFVEDEAGEIQYDLKSDNMYKIVVIFTSDVEINNCIVGYILQNKKGVSIINSNTLVSGNNKYFNVKSHSYNRVEFKIKLPRLYADEYIIDCAVASGKSVMDNVTHAWCYGALKVMIHNEKTILALLDVPTDISIYECDQLGNSETCLQS